MSLKKAIKSFLRQRLGVDIVRYDNHPTVEGAQWEQSGITSTLPLTFKKRIYETYEEYTLHQSSKLSKLDLSDYDVKYRSALKERLAKLNLLQRGDTVLCLAARIGTECKAFIDLGCFTIGIDLNPGEGNRYVTHGDFHNLQFANASVDCVFTNSLDHAFDFDKVISEILRVLKPNGTFIAEIVAGSKDNSSNELSCAYESLWWEKIDDLVEYIAQYGLEVEQREQFSFPWQGDQVIFHRT
jgi:SAM-dependent methyltransferase